MNRPYLIHKCPPPERRGVRLSDFGRLALTVPAAFVAAYVVAWVAFNF